MSITAKQSTARTVTVGPILDEDGVAVTDAVVGDLEISKNGAAPAALNGSATLTHRNTGHYSLALTTSDLDTVGSAEIVIDDTTNAMPVKTITVIEEAVYDAMFAASATGLLPANVTQIAGNGTNATNLGTAASNYSATRGLAGTALPAAAAGAAGGLVISDAGGLDVDAKLANTNEVTAARMAALTDWIDGGRLDLLIDGISAKTTNLPASPASETTLAALAAKFTGITSVAGWLRWFGRKDAALATDDATSGTEINADGGSGAGAFDNTTDSQEALRDNQSSGSSSNPTTLQTTTIATLASQTSFTLTAGSADDDAYNGRLIVFTDQSTGTQKSVGVISDYTGSTKTVTLEAAPEFTIATGDSVDVLAMGDTRAASIDTIFARTGQGVSVNADRQADSSYNFPSAIVRGTDYNSTAGNAWTWTLVGFPASPWQSGTTGTLEFKQGCDTSWTEVGTIALSHDGDETLTPSSSFTDTESSSLTAGVSTCYRLTLTNGTNTWVTTGSWSVTD